MCEQAELKALQERLDIDKQHWEENYKKKEVCHSHTHSIYSSSEVSGEEITSAGCDQATHSLTHAGMSGVSGLSQTRDKCQEEVVFPLCVAK